MMLLPFLALVAFAQLPAPPSPGWFSCSCGFTREYRQSCSGLYDTLKTEIGRWNNGSPAGGSYNITMSGQDTTTNQYYILGDKTGNGNQDWMFTFTDADTDYCSVAAISVGKSWVCFYDFGNNYCTIEEPLSFFSFESNTYNGCRATSSNCSG